MFELNKTIESIAQIKLHTQVPAVLKRISFLLERVLAAADDAKKKSHDSHDGRGRRRQFPRVSELLDRGRDFYTDVEKALRRVAKVLASMVRDFAGRDQSSAAAIFSVRQVYYRQIERERVEIMVSSVAGYHRIAYRIYRVFEHIISRLSFFGAIINPLRIEIFVLFKAGRYFSIKFQVEIGQNST